MFCTNGVSGNFHEVDLFLVGPSGAGE
jgi:hypothetical protein